MTIEPGTQVRVLTEGVVGVTDEWGTPIKLQAGNGITLNFADPALTVTPIDPDRPTLTKAAIAAAIDEANFQYDGYGGSWIDTLSQGVVALIEAAHPGLIR